MATAVTFDELTELRDEFADSLRAQNKAPLTIKSYKLAVDQLATFLRDKGMPTKVRAIRREHIEAFLNDLTDKGMKPATVAQRYRSLQQWFRYLVDEDEISVSPMLKMKPPKVEAPLVPVLRPEQVRALLRVCEGRTFADRRDAAIIRLFLATGMRRAEMAGLRLEDLDMERRVLTIAHGKGDRPRLVRFDLETRKALRRYLQERERHPQAASERLWIGHAGDLREDGVRYVVERRGKAAGIEGLHPHQFRHTRAHTFLSGGLSETDVQLLMGWRSPQMLRRYGASAAVERALDAFDKVEDRH